VLLACAAIVEINLLLSAVGTCGCCGEKFAVIAVGMCGSCGEKFAV